MRPARVHTSRGPTQGNRIGSPGDETIGLPTKVPIRQTGPGRLDSVYAACPSFELGQAQIPLLRQAGVPVFDKGINIPFRSRADMRVADTP